MSTPPKQIQVPKTLDVDAVEQVLAGLWHNTFVEPAESDNDAVMRARTANLMVFLTSDAALAQTQDTIRELAVIHPCRALIMLADRDGPNLDIEMFVAASCQSDRRSQKAELCCEEVTLVARGHFTSELPSAALPLLVPDLPVFLWWHDLERLSDDCFQPLSSAAERLVIDSVDLAAMNTDLATIERLLSQKGNDAIAVSDINWARLTSWRALLASFYDVQEYLPALTDLERVAINYTAPESNPNGIATQALLIAGWLASRLHWNIESSTNPDKTAFSLLSEAGRRINLELKRVEHPAMKPGRLAKVELQANGGEDVFTVQRSDDGLHLETQAVVEGRSCPGRSLPVRNRSTAYLLSLELEILSKDTTYEAAVRVAARLGS